MDFDVLGSTIRPLKSPEEVEKLRLNLSVPSPVTRLFESSDTGSEMVWSKLPPASTRLASVRFKMVAPRAGRAKREPEMEVCAVKPSGYSFAFGRLGRIQLTSPLKSLVPKSAKV